jgi:hypothetical protein
LTLRDIQLHDLVLETCTVNIGERVIVDVPKSPIIEATKVSVQPAASPLPTLQHELDVVVKSFIAEHLSMEFFSFFISIISYAYYICSGVSNVPNNSFYIDWLPHHLSFTFLASNDAHQLFFKIENVPRSIGKELLIVFI